MLPTEPPSPETLAAEVIANIEAVAPTVAPDDHDRLLFAVQDTLSLLARIYPDAAQRLEAGRTR